MKTEKLAEKPKVPETERPTSNGDPGELKRVAYGSVRPDPNQPRKVFTAVAMSELTESIRESGITQPLLVRFVPGLVVVEPDLVNKQWQVLADGPQGPGTVVASGTEKSVREFVKGKEEGYYQIVDGERRWRAAGVLKLPELPVIVRKLDARQIFTIQFVANQQRENLSALEEARAFQEQIAVRRKTEPGYNADALAKEVGMSRSHVFGRLALTRLQPSVEQAVLSGKISVSVAGLVAMVPEPKQQEALLKRLTDEEDYRYPYSFRDVQELLEKEYVRQLDKAPFGLKDEKLVPAVWKVEGRGKGRPKLNDAGVVSEDEILVAYCSTMPVLPTTAECVTAPDTIRSSQQKIGDVCVWEGHLAPSIIGAKPKRLFGPAHKTECQRFHLMVERGYAMTVSVHYGGACASCPKRSGNMAELFPELAKRPNVCTDPKCYAAKEKAGLEAKLEAAKAKGERILSPAENKNLFPSWSPTQLAHGTSYVRLTDCCYEDPKRRTYEQLLKKDAPAPVMAVNGAGQLTKLYPKKEVAAALKEKKFAFMEKDTRNEQEQAVRDKLLKQREALGPKLLEEVLAKLETLPTDSATEGEFWRFVMGWLSEDRWVSVAHRRGLKGTADKATAKMGLKEVRNIVVEMVLHDDYEGFVATEYDGKWIEAFANAAEFAGLDLKAREKALMEPELPKQGEKELTAKVLADGQAKSTKKGKEI